MLIAITRFAGMIILGAHWRPHMVLSVGAFVRFVEATIQHPCSVSTKYPAVTIRYSRQEY